MNVIKIPGIKPVERVNGDQWGLMYPTHYYLSQHYLDKFDWFLKADDDTYVVVANLRAYLSLFDPNKPYYMGHRAFHAFKPHGHNLVGSTSTTTIKYLTYLDSVCVTGWCILV